MIFPDFGLSTPVLQNVILGFFNIEVPVSMLKNNLISESEQDNRNFKLLPQAHNNDWKNEAFDYKKFHILSDHWKIFLRTTTL